MIFCLLPVLVHDFNYRSKKSRFNTLLLLRIKNTRAEKKWKYLLHTRMRLDKNVFHVSRNKQGGLERSIVVMG